MKGLESGKDKVKKICEALKQETLDPAKREAEEILAYARLQAEEVIQGAEKKKEEILLEAKREVERQKAAFHASLKQASRQVIETLKQQIEEKLFDPLLSQIVAKASQEPNALAQLITVVVKAIEKEGIEANLSVYIPAAIAARDVNSLLAQEILNRLKEKSVLLSPIGGGIEVKLKDQEITIDISDATLKELLAMYIRKDFREMLFVTT